MTVPTRSDAQRRVDAIRVFREELARLRAENMVSLSEEQEHAVAEYHDSLLAELSAVYDIDRDARAKQLSLGMRIASFLGALALAASIFFLFYQFWGVFPTAGQVTILIAAALLSFAGTVWLHARDPSGYFTKLAAMVAFVCFVLNVVMLGQIFNITPSDNAFIAWAAYAMLLAYAFDLRLLLAAGILCVMAFVSARVGVWSGLYWLSFGERPENFFVSAAILFLVPLFIRHDRFPGFAAIYRVFALIALFLPMLVLGNWGDGSYLDMDPDVIEGMYQILGFLLSAAFVWIGTRRHWREVVNTAMTFFVVFLYTKLFDWWWETMPKYLFFLILGLTAVLFLLVLRRLRAREGAAPGGESA